MGDVERNKKAVLAMHDSVNRNDLDGMFDVMTEDITFRVVGKHSLGGRIYQGKDDITRHLFFEIFQRLEGGIEISISNLVADSEIAFLHFMGKATMKNGSLYHNEYVQIFRFRDGKISGVVEFMDSLLLAEVLKQPTSIEGVDPDFRDTI